MDVLGKEVSKACVVCSWETFELVAEQKVGHKTARGSHSSWPWKRDSESSQPTEGNITLEATKIKEKLQHLNDCLGRWCKWQRTKWTNWMMWKWTNTLCALMPCLCSFNCCFLTLSHSVHEPSSSFLGWALTRCSEKELGAGLLHVDVMWSLERSLQGLAPGTEASTLKSGCSNSLLQKAARAQQWEAQTPLTPQPSRCPPCPSYPPAPLPASCTHFPAHPARKTICSHPSWQPVHPLWRDAAACPGCDRE